MHKYTDLGRLGGWTVPHLKLGTRLVPTDSNKLESGIKPVPIGTTGSGSVWSSSWQFSVPLHNPNKKCYNNGKQLCKSSIFYQTDNKDVKEI